MNSLRNCWLLAVVLMISLALTACEEATTADDGSGSGSGGTVRGCGTTIVDNAVSPPAWIHGTWYSEATRAVRVVTFTSDNMILSGVDFKAARYASIMSDSATANAYTFKQCNVSPERVTTVTFRGTSTRVTMVTVYDPPITGSGIQNILVK